MSLLISDEALAARAAAVRSPGASLAPLAASLLGDLRAALERSIEVPVAKAMLSRDGGRCPDHGVPLDFDPFEPHDHRCPIDGTVWRGERHDRWWLMWYQLWLAERAVHAAALAALGIDASLASFAARVLDAYSDRYLMYPNRDNVLGPSRPFFSTYLESIWLLQIAIALDLLETAGLAGTLGPRVRERIIEPSTALIASFDEGGSNRQVWNDAALIAGGTLLGESRIVQRAIASPSGVLSQLSHGLLSDGTWYEGENYHLFAHRGLWYGVTMMERIGVPIPPSLGDRFAEAFATPLLSALPDFTFPSRRDSQYAVSLRQWRFAESCELGLARRDDRRLTGALWILYGDGAPRGRSDRWRSTAESERREPAMTLGRADLGWRSLLLARETLPPLEPAPPKSALLAGQGLAVFRRDAGETYLALDYGHAGGGHGHPDRLNVLLAHGDDRWLDDMGTGSYVDPSLHWYRSTLAHNAPLLDGRSQPAGDGTLRAYDERGGVGWVDAAYDVPNGSTRLRRSLVVMPDYAVDRLTWHSEEPVQIDLPVHVEATVRGVAPFVAGVLSGGDATTDGFGFVHDAEITNLAAGRITTLERDGKEAAFLIAGADAELWRATAPAAPGLGERRMFVVRTRGASATITTVWNWSSHVSSVTSDGEALVVALADGSMHSHRLELDEWHVAFEMRGAQSSVTLGGRAPAAARDEQPAATATPAEPLPVPTTPDEPLIFELGHDAYRQSEETWVEAGSPSATVRVRMEAGQLAIAIDVRKSPVVFRAPDAADPRLDNEDPDIHSDGVQMHIWTDAASAPLAWLAVPIESSSQVRIHVPDGARRDVDLAASWRRTASGYAMDLRLPVAALESGGDGAIAMQVVVNDMAPGRERRRGQLVVSGGAGEWVYLRGDRESPAHARRFVVTHG